MFVGMPVSSMKACGGLTPRPRAPDRFQHLLAKIQRHDPLPAPLANQCREALGGLASEALADRPRAGGRYRVGRSPYDVVDDADEDPQPEDGEGAEGQGAPRAATPGGGPPSGKLQNLCIFA